MAARPPMSGNGSLYVGDLHQEVTETVLFDTFKDLGPIINIRVCRDTVTRTSLGYAYVNFQNPSDAERAIETLNYTSLKGKPIRIMWSQRDPSLRRSGVGNVFAKNLPKSIDNKGLYDVFSAYGNILSCKVVTDDEGVSKGHGFIHFDGDEPATKAVAEMNGTELDGVKIFVGPFIKRSQRMSGLLTRFTNVYVKEMIDMDASELKEKFSKFGEVTSACTRKEARMGNKAFGFVNFATHEMAVKAIDEWHGKEVEGLSTPGSVVYCQRAMKRAERDIEIRKRFLAEKAKRQYPPANNLYVKNLGDETTNDELKKLFSPFGTITSSVVMIDSDNKHRGFGFVCYKEAEEAQKALLEMNGKMFGAKPLYVNIAQKKDARRSMLELEYAQRRAMPPQAFMPPAPGYYNPMYYGMGHHPSAHFGANAGKGWGAPTRGGKGGRGMPMGRGGWPTRGGGRGGTRGGHAQHFHQKPSQQHQQPPAAQPPAQQAAATDNEPINAETLAAMSPQAQKNALGEQLYHKIAESHPEQVAKITGMLLEMDVSEILNLLESPEVLTSKINEALLVLKTHTTN